MTAEDINRRFDYVPPDAERRRLHEQVRAMCKHLALAFDKLLPNSPDKERAIDALDDAFKHANAAIARGPRFRRRRGQVLTAADLNSPLRSERGRRYELDGDDDDGAAGTRVPNNPVTPRPTGSGAATTGGNTFTATVVLSGPQLGHQLHDLVVQAEQRSRMRNGLTLIH